MGRDTSGMTLVELLIAAALLGVGILAAFGSFSLAQRSISSSKARTLAVNLAQQEMQVMMQKSYFEILVTTNVAYNTNYSPSIPYDQGYFQPQTVSQGGISFTYLTYVEVVQEVNGVITPLPPTTPDTGIRRITFTVVWQGTNGPESTTLKSIINNPNTVMSTVIIQGTITDATTHLPIPSAIVDFAEDVGWRDTTNALGNYLINMSPGAFHFSVSAPGYFPLSYYMAIAPNSNPIQNAALTPISTTTVTGSAWLNAHLVVSEVVASTGPGNGTEYVELYNPTTSTFNIGSGATPTINLYVFDRSNNTIPNTGLVPVSLTYVSTCVVPSQYYLIANTTTVTVNGVNRQADAYYAGVSYPTHYIPQADAGGLGIADLTPNPIDSLAWSNLTLGHACPSTPTEGVCIPSVTGLLPNEMYIRHSDTSTVVAANGRAYDSNNNSVDFMDVSPITSAPNNTLSGTYPPVTGTPATGANISITDGLSTSVKAAQMGSPPYAHFSVTSVATGTWTVFLDSGTSSAEIDNVMVVSNSSTSLGNVILSTQGVTGSISGTVLTAYNSVIPSPGVSVGVGSLTSTVNSTTGHYSIRLPPGTYDVTANPGLTNSMYQTQTYTGVTVSLGDETANENFTLSQGGELSGWVTRDGINPLSGVSVIAMDSNGTTHDTEVSSNNGSFTLINLTTGPYTVETVLDSKETSSPSSLSATVVAGTTVAVGTFTVTGAMGIVSGQVTVSGSPIQTGVLIVASTATVSAPPPAISSNTLTQASYYNTSSLEDGTYSLPVRGSTSTVYNVVGFYTKINGTSVVISSRAISGVSVIAGGTASGQNFSW